MNDFTSMDFLNLRLGLWTHDYIGQRVHQIPSIRRNLSFFDENVPTLVRNRTFIRYLVIRANIRWSNLHRIGLDMHGIKLDLCDPTTDDLTRYLLSTISDGIGSPDRGVIISCMKILYKLCQKATKEDYLHRCLDKNISTTAPTISHPNYVYSERQTTSIVHSSPNSVSTKQTQQQQQTNQVRAI